MHDKTSPKASDITGRLVLDRSGHNGRSDMIPISVIICVKRIGQTSPEQVAALANQAAAIRQAVAA